MFTWFYDRHELDPVKMTRHFWRIPLEGVFHVQDQVLLLKRAHHDAVDLAVVQNAHEDNS
jgi:hypothetical protein